MITLPFLAGHAWYWCCHCWRMLGRQPVQIQYLKSNLQYTCQLRGMCANQKKFGEV
jgi:hypothetical protein